MDAIFIVPAMVSPQVNKKIVPPLIKMIERNILLSNAASFRTAALRKYSSIFSSSLRDQTELLEKDSAEEKNKGGKKEEEKKSTPSTAKTGAAVLGKNVSSKEVHSFGQSSFSKADQYEEPRGISFFNSVSLEPTYLMIPIEQKTSMFMPTEKSERMIQIGVKCVPYQVEGVKDIVAMMEIIKSMSIIESYFFSMWNSIKAKIPLTKGWWIRKGYRGGKKPVLLPNGKEVTEEDYEKTLDIIFAPTSRQLSDPGYLKKLISGRKSNFWSTLAVLSVEDFSSRELKTTFETYKRLVVAGWGDLVIDNYLDDSVYFCTQKLGACYQMSYRMVKQSMRASDIFDYSDVKSYKTPFRVTTVGKALSDGVNYDPNLNTQDRILEIIQGDK